MRWRRTRPMAGVAVGALAGSLLAGCVQLPEGGPVVETRTSSQADDDQASAIDARPPVKGASALDIANGFLDAMYSWPVETSVARQFLEEDSAATWNPEAATIVYDDALPPQDSSNEVTMQLSGAEKIDGRGSWQGALPEDEQNLSFRLVVEDGEYRVADPPDALVVPASWFAQRFRQVSLYFFDQTGQILVPKPVFVPRGEQLASTLTARLLEGPGVDDRGTSRSYFPAGLGAGLSVPVSEDGVADIALSGGALPQDPQSIDRMLAQLGWTLRQEPSIRALRVSVDGEELSLPGGGGEYRVDAGEEYAPTGSQASTLLFGLRDGLLVSGDGESFSAAPGPLGETDYGLRSVAVDLDAYRAAGIGDDGTSVLLAPVRIEEGQEDQASGSVNQIVVGATDLLPPAWDFTDRLWLVDRTALGARVSYRERGRLREIEVPGVTGRRVTSFAVSRDGTRFVAVVRGARRGAPTDQVRVGRIQVDSRRRVSRVTRTAVIAPDRSEQLRVQDIAWTSPTSIAVLSEVDRGELYEVSTIAVDGAPAALDALSTTVNEKVIGLAGTPVPESTQYAVTRTGLRNLTTDATAPFDEEGIDYVDYVG